jgi:serine/threonine-protein kinase
MLQLKTFGGLSVAIDDAPGDGAAQQRKTLALLAILAAAGRTGLSRDKLVAYLWPEVDAEHARALLKQACYALRRDLHQPDLLLGTTQLRLNPAVIASDVQAFAAALERHVDAEAAALYTGPFLDGFYLNDSAEFERWVEAERNQLRQHAGAALERLASDATARGDHHTAVEWWRRLVALDGLNSRVALGLMNALAATGDPGGALRVAEEHKSVLRADLDASPDPSVVRMTERLRAEAERAPGPVTRAVPMPAGRQAVAHTAGEVRPSPMGRRRVRLALAVTVCGLLPGGWLLFGALLGAGTARDPKKIVVLPFVNLGRAEDEYFADGITEEITARLASTDRMHVIGSTSANVYKDRKRTIAEIGRELGVDYVLEGSIRWQKSPRGPRRVRITPQLVSTVDGTHLWAGIYDEPLDEIFRVQSDIAQKVVQALDVTLPAASRGRGTAAPTRNLQAYDYYLRGNDYMRRGTEERGAQAAMRMYEKAVELDPTFALAYARLSRMHSRMYLSHHDRSEDRLAQAKRAVDRAFALQPDLPEAHHSLGTYYFIGYLDYERALREFAIAEAGRPNDSDIFLARAVLRTRQGKFREALEDFEKARQLDPGSSVVAGNYAQAYDWIRDFAHAEALYDRAITLAPDRANPYFMKAGLYLRWDGSTRRARAVLEEAETARAIDDPLVLFAGVLVDVFDQRYEQAIGRLSARTPEVVEDQNRFIPRALLYAQVYGLMRRHDLEQAYYDSARSFLSTKVRERPADPRLRSALGIAYAGLGLKQEAIREGEIAVELLPISREARRGYFRLVDLARIYTMVGEHNSAVDRLQSLLSTPGHLTPAWLRIDPTWDPLRGHPRFERLVGLRE